MASSTRLTYLLVLVVELCLSGCAGVTVKPLNADGTASTGEEGLRYYRPEPYLLVAALPPTPPSSNPGVTIPNPQDIPPNGTEKDIKQKKKKTVQGNNSGQGNNADQANWNGPDLGPGAGANTPPKDDSSKKNDTSSTPAPTPTASADVSFAASTPQYAIRLVYLPDYSHPLAMSMHSGVFGTTSFAPALQDGWMLTSLQASGDNKVAETLTAVGSIVGALHGGGASAAGSSGKDKGAPGAAPSAELTDSIGKIIDESNVILRPGLYRFQYDSSGHLAGLCAVAFFSKDGAKAQTGCEDKSPTDAKKATATPP